MLDLLADLSDSHFRGCLAGPEATFHPEFQGGFQPRPEGGFLFLFIVFPFPLHDLGAGFCQQEPLCQHHVEDHADDAVGFLMLPLEGFVIKIQHRGRGAVVVALGHLVHHGLIRGQASLPGQVVEQGFGIIDHHLQPRSHGATIRQASAFKTEICQCGAGIVLVRGQELVLKHLVKLTAGRQADILQ